MSDALPLVIESEEKLKELPEQFRGFYSPKDGKFTLDVAPRKDIHRFMDSSREAEAKAKKASADFEGLDPTEARESVALKRRLEEKKLLEKGDVDAVLARREEAARAEERKKADAAESRASASDKRLSQVLIDAELAKAVVESDIVDTALKDVLLLGQSQFRVVGGELQTADGIAVPETGVKAWLRDQLKERPHWLKPSSGGGTPPKSPGGGTPPAKQRSKMSHQEKADYQRTHGMAAYNKLPR